jgi:hypothetical protein
MTATVPRHASDGTVVLARVDGRRQRVVVVGIGVVAAVGIVVLVALGGLAASRHDDLATGLAVAGVVVFAVAWWTAYANEVRYRVAVDGDHLWVRATTWSGPIELGDLDAVLFSDSTAGGPNLDLLQRHVGRRLALHPLALFNVRATERLPVPKRRLRTVRIHLTQLGESRLLPLIAPPILASAAYLSEAGRHRLRRYAG